MITARIEAFPLRIPFKPGAKSAASAWGPKHLNVRGLAARQGDDRPGIGRLGRSVGFRAVPLTQRAIDEVIGPLCIGRDASRIAPIMRPAQDSDPTLVRAAVRQALDAGFSSLKLHEKELSEAKAAREEAGLDVVLMLDVNCAWTVNGARARSEEL